MKTIPLTQGKVALVDDADYADLARYKWYATKKGGPWYAKRNSPRTGGRHHAILLHRVLLDAPPGLEVDHINGNGLDNRRANLRLATHAENQYNRRPLGGTSRFKGVCWNREHGKWRAAIRTGGKDLYLGYYATEEDAARAYDAAALQYFGVFARLNFPGDAVEEMIP